MMNNIIDCRGLKCPQPVINTKKHFDAIENGEALIIVDNEVAKNNVSKLAQNSGFKYEVLEKEGLYEINIKKEVSGCEIIDSKLKKFIIVVSTDKLGLGNDELGTLLMKSYMYALSESDRLPDDLIFLNGGVKLTTEGSECIDSIRKLQDIGVNILSCGTCLDFYNIKDKLLVGEISNMYTIVEKMNNAENTIKI
jgi:selenium metabolism protein YedF